ncbi:MAG TPA: SPOR domain-containing protein [Gammaproteobacteria bacterium]|nr:SPOR domain-containing protein [Gammaproteobacteria bacterium]
MEQKKIQRIIGIIVIIALVAIVMPLLFGKNDYSTQEASNVKTTLPIPNQQSTLSNNAQPENEARANPVEMQASQKLPEPPVLSAQTNPAAAEINSLASEKKVSDPAPAVGNIIYDTPSAAPPIPSAQEEVNKKPVDQAVSTTSSDTNNVKKNEEVKEPVKVQPIMIQKKSVHPKVVKSIHAKASISHHKKEMAVWVVQVGNFAVKQNAIHLANVLRAAGYKAFTHDVKSSIGKISTRVYVGPELKQASAVQLSHTIHRNLSLPGFVVSYRS